MRERTVKDTELDIVLSDVRKYSLSPEGAEYISPERVTSDVEILKKRYEKIDSLRAKLNGGENPLLPFPSLKDIFGFIQDTHLDLDGKDIYRAGDFLHSLSVLLKFEGKEDEIIPDIKKIEDDILSSLDYEGTLNPLHPRLLPLIRKRDERKSERYRFSLSFIADNRTIVQNENPVYRNERVVIPIFSKDKKGGEYYISGESASGNTTFVEPFQLVDLNNKVVLAEEEIKKEIKKILHDLSESVRSISGYLEKMTDYVKLFSFHYSFAVWSIKNRCSHIEKSDDVLLVDASHPLLGDKAVPISIHIPSNIRSLVLSGANCGGKSVTMKTIALCSLLNQISTYIPASGLSHLPYFDSVLTDIGDGQSIENEESTFSSHMANIAYITKHSSKNSLVILDELGSSTDPAEGSALALSILKYLSSRSFLTIVTSHYGSIKSYAYAEENMMNASMEFDEKTSSPTYRVLEGIPGESHALNSARRAGVPMEIIQDASSSIEDKSADVSKIITSLLSKSRTLDRKISEAERTRRAGEDEMKRIEEKEKRLESLLLSVEKDGSKDLSRFIKESRKELENLVRMVKTGELTSEKTKSVKAYIKRIEEKEEKVNKDIEEREERIDVGNPDALFSPGDDVLYGRDRIRGKVVSLKDDKSIVVLFDNGLRMTVKKKDLVNAEPEEAKAGVSYFSSNVKKAKYVLDVRGMTLSETERSLDDEIEACLLEGLKSFSIIHGYGDGILQKGVHLYLKRNRYVKDYGFALPEDGGMGKTYVTLCD